MSSGSAKMIIPIDARINIQDIKFGRVNLDEEQIFQTSTPKKNEQKHLINPLLALRLVLNKNINALKEISIEIGTIKYVLLCEPKIIRANRK